MQKIQSILYDAARIVAALILLQTLYFKFTGSSESVYIFTTVGVEPWGRIMAGVLELVAAILLLVRVSAWLGSILALGMMAGALGMHLTLLGIEVQGDGGYLFFLAVLVAVCSAFVLVKNKAKIMALIQNLKAVKKDIARSR